MGWFDDSDSEDEKRKRKRPLLETFQDDTVHNNNNNNICTNTNHHQETTTMDVVDPLDAFMNNLSSSTSRINYDTDNKMKKSVRLDMENDDDDDNYNYSNSNNIHTISSSLSSASKPQHSFQSQESIKAKIAMDTIFHKAGGATKRNKQEQEEEEHNIHDDENNDNDHYSLDKINHTMKQYIPFRKIFLNPMQIQKINQRQEYHDDINNTHFGIQWRKENNISCSIQDIDPILNFEQYSALDEYYDNQHHYHNHYDNQLHHHHHQQQQQQQQQQQRQLPLFDPAILSYLDKNNFKKATLVQAQSIPLALCGKDLIVTSHTGSGKTLAYLLPLVTHILDQPHIEPKVDGPISIILTPTRELAKQVHLIAKKLLSLVHGKAISVTGGLGSYEMAKELQKGCEVIISTPGRLIDMVKRKATNFDRVTFVVLDEADKMLDMGFEKQVACILESVRPDRQTLMFSATFGKRVERVAKGWLNHDAVRVAVGKTGTSSEHVDQHVLVLPSQDAKMIWMTEMLPILSSLGKMIIFVSSKADCESITQMMKDSPHIGGKGLLVDSIHGDKHQIDRNAALTSLRKGKLAALIATDVASRGLDVDNIQTVVNFDAAKNLDSHVHRIGRAGRLNASKHEHKKGVAYTLLTQKNSNFAKILMESFEREGREVSDDLMKLAMKSIHFSGGGKKRSKAGLGFDEDETAVNGASSFRKASSNYYGPPSMTSKSNNSKHG